MNLMEVLSTRNIHPEQLTYALVRIKRLSLTENYGNTKPLDDAVFEMPIDYDPGYRLYCALRGNDLALLLMGGADPRSREASRGLRSRIRNMNDGDKDEESNEMGCVRVP